MLAVLLLANILVIWHFHHYNANMLVFCRFNTFVLVLFVSMQKFANKHKSLVKLISAKHCFFS